MAPGFRALTDYVLAEIALRGSQGASPADVLSFIDAFYKSPSQRGYEATKSDHKALIDRRFQEKAWTWLMRHPDVSIQNYRDKDGLTLTEAESTQKSEASSTNETEDQTIPLRVLVSHVRIWLAITGHEPDETRVFPTEFVLLSIIASRKSQGILQTELVKVSRQDKRSVPKRTDVLRNKGYIEKRQVQVKGAKTSLCTLQRFVPKTPTFDVMETPAGRDVKATHEAGDVIDFEVFISKLFEILKQCNVISRDDLKRALGFNDRWRWRILSRALRRFEHTGCVKRVRAQSQYHDTLDALHSCVMFLREPTERDLETFHEDSKVLFSNLEQENDNHAEIDDDVDAEMTERGMVTVAPSAKQEVIEESGRLLPQWTPDRNVHNIIFDVIKSAGTVGKTNADTIKASFGRFFRRPLENTLSRLVECWQISQPPHLRHLAIVRDTAVVKTITHYVHFTAESFRELVNSGAASWEAVIFHAKDAKSQKLIVPPVDIHPVLDDFGLPPINPGVNLINEGDATLLECVAAVDPSDYRISQGDPVAVVLSGGTHTVKFRHDKIPSGALRRVPASNLAGGRRTGTREISTSDQQDTISLVPAKRASPHFEIHEEPRLENFKRPRLSKRHPSRFIGMSARERLEALGMDETWTEYNVLLIERLGPGLYLTPRGKRRPAGERRGRPKHSRIAIFKSLKLQSFPWFFEEAKHTLDPEAIDSESPVPVGTSQEPQQEHIGTIQEKTQEAARRGKRTHIDITVRALPDSATPPIADAENDRPSKRPHLDHTEIADQGNAIEFVTGVNESNEMTGQETPTANNTKVPNKGSWKRGLPKARSKQAGVQKNVHTRVLGEPAPLNSEISNDVVTGAVRRVDEIDGEPVPKRICVADTVQELLGGNATQNQNLSVVSAVTSDTHENENTSHDPAHLRTHSDETDTKSEGLDRTHGVDGYLAQEEKSSATIICTTEVHPGAPSDEIVKTPGGRIKKKRAEKGGSVTFLRRKIIMDTVEMSGGAFPLGTELWYPFVTAWRKTNHTEKPDLRTVRSTTKSLIDAGKLKQFIFSGKDSKGVMVTKQIIAKPEISRDDAIVKDLQQKMLTSKEQYYIPPGAEVDRSISKSNGRPVPNRTFGSLAKLPVEPNVTVQLQHKPASVLAQEKRKGRIIQRRLLQVIGADTLDGRHKPVRLMKIQRTPGLDPTIDGMTSISRPVVNSMGSLQHRRRPVPTSTNILASVTSGMKRPLYPLSTIAPYAMLMNPRQRFHAPTGTFACDASLSGHRREMKTAIDLPNSLVEIFSQVKRPKAQAMRSLSFDSRYAKFCSDIDTTARWEVQNEALFDARTNKHIFINQAVSEPFEVAPIQGSIEFENVDPSPAPGMPPPQITRSQTSMEFGNAFGTLTSPSRVRLKQPSSMLWPFMPGQSPRAMSKESKVARNLILAEPKAKTLRRRNWTCKNLSEALVRKLQSAIVVVRTLTGGFEGKNIDWVLVAKAFPDHDSEFIRERGKAVLSRNRLQMAKMKSDFQERFIEAYEKDEVPRIDYNDLEGYDWSKVAEWADSQVDVPLSQKTPDLPATREQFDLVFELREEPLSDELEQLYTNNPVATLGKKHSIVASVPFAIPLREESKGITQKQNQVRLSRIETAKSWIRANVIAGEETYDAVDARRALARFTQPLIDEALQSLITERAIAMGNRGRITPGRNFYLTEIFQVIFGRKRAIDFVLLKQAVRYKTEVLDRDFRGQGFSEVKYNATDGDILAIVNLVEQQQVILKPHNPPRNAWGLTDGNYETRVIDRAKFRFTVQIWPVQGKYVEGNPIWDKLTSIPPPRGDMDIGRHVPIDDAPPVAWTPMSPPPLPPPTPTEFPGRVPIWFDVNGNLARSMWDQAVAAVIGIVAIRPRINAATIANMIKPTIGAWEVILILEWLTQVGVVKRVQSEREQQQQSPAQEDQDLFGWVVKDWWWLTVV